MVVDVLATVVVVVTVVDVTVLYAVVAAGTGVKIDCRVTGRTDPWGLFGGSWDWRPYSTYWKNKLKDAVYSLFPVYATRNTLRGSGYEHQHLTPVPPT